MQWIQFAIFGLIAGALARLLHPGKDPMGFLMTMILGMAGSEVGGFLAKQAGMSAEGGLMSWVAAIGGAILLLVVYHFLTAGKATALDGPSGTATNADYKEAVFNDLSQGPR